MKIEVTKEWCTIMAMLEGDAEIGAGWLAADPVFDEESERDSGDTPERNGQ